MGGRSDGWKGDLWVLFCKWHAAGVLWCNFSWGVIGCEMRLRHGVFLGEIGTDPSWVMWKDVWLEIFDGTWLGHL